MRKALPVQFVKPGGTHDGRAHWGVSFNNAGKGFLHHAAWNCPGLTEVVDGKMTTNGGLCTLTDQAGEKIFANWNGGGALGGEFAGELTFSGGTGKYEGLTGGLTFSCFGAGTSGLQLYCTQKVTYKLQ